MGQLPQEMIDFICEAYGMPAEIRAKLIDEHDNLEDRNIAMLAGCFGAFVATGNSILSKSTGIENIIMDFLALPKELQNSEFDKFLELAANLYMHRMGAHLGEIQDLLQTKDSDI